MLGFEEHQSEFSLGVSSCNTFSIQARGRCNRCILTGHHVRQPLFENRRRVPPWMTAYIHLFSSLSHHHPSPQTLCRFFCVSLVHFIQCNQVQAELQHQYLTPISESATPPRCDSVLSSSWRMPWPSHSTFRTDHPYNLLYPPSLRI